MPGAAVQIDKLKPALKSLFFNTELILQQKIKSSAGIKKVRKFKNERFLSGTEIPFKTENQGSNLEKQIDILQEKLFQSPG